ncbi:hypothetical protein ADUPG1_005995, partial [Aduncisulcus paluster]
MPKRTKILIIDTVNSRGINFFVKLCGYPTLSWTTQFETTRRDVIYEKAVSLQSNLFNIIVPTVYIPNLNSYNLSSHNIASAFGIVIFLQYRESPLDLLLKHRLKGLANFTSVASKSTVPKPQ